MPTNGQTLKDFYDIFARYFCDIECLVVVSEVQWTDTINKIHDPSHRGRRVITTTKCIKKCFSFDEIWDFLYARLNQYVAQFKVNFFVLNSYRMK